MRTGRARAQLSAVFLDRDGVINEKAPEGGYVTSWSEFRFLPGALSGLRRLAAAELPTYVVTNQRGIARGDMSPADLEDIHRRMVLAVAAAGGRLDGIYHCPHDHGCPGRKPGVGMFERAAREHQLVLSDAAVIGDQPSDMLAAARIGALRVLVGSALAPADHVAPDLDAAVEWLLVPAAARRPPR